MSDARRFWVPLLGTALVVRLLFSLGLIAGWPLVSDGFAYSEQARQMTGELPGTQEYYVPPGTSYVLAAAYELFGSGRGSARITMILVSMLTVVATVYLARRVLNDERTARRAGWIIALLPSAVFMPSQPFSFDVTMLGLTLCVLWSLMAWDRRQARWLALAGLALGCAATARPGVISILAALVPAALLGARGLWRAGERARVRLLAVGAVAFAVLMVAPLLPAINHNDEVGVGATVSTNNEGNLLFGNNPYTRDYKTWHQGQSEATDPDEVAYLDRWFTLGGPPERRKEMRDEALDYIVDHPGTTAWRTANRVRAFWGFDYTFSNGLRADSAAPLPVVGAAGLLEVGGWFVFCALALAGVFLGRRLFVDRRLLLLLAVVLAYELPHIVAFSAGRWHLPVLAVLAPIAAAGLTALGSPREAFARVRSSRALIIALGVFALIQVEYAYFVLIAA